MTGRLLLVCCTAAAFVSATAAGQAPPPGVGFQAVTIEDGARAYTWADGSVTARPVRVFIWYPAGRSSTGPLTLAGYVERTFRSAARPRLPEGDAVAQALADWVGYGLGADVSLNQVQDLLARPTPAHLDARATRGQHPIVVLAGGLGAPAFLQYRIAEAFATSGYVVVAVAGLGRAEGHSLSLRDGGPDELAADLGVALRHARARPDAASDRLAGIAWSMGGLALVRLALDDPRLGVLVSLDSGLGYDYGAAAVRAMPASSLARLTVPFVHIAATPPASVPQDFSYFSVAAPGEGWWRREPGLTHAQFTSLGLLGAETATADISGLIAAHTGVIDDALAAVRAYLGGDSGARRTLERRFERR